MKYLKLFEANNDKLFIELTTDQYWELVDERMLDITNSDIDRISSRVRYNIAKNEDLSSYIKVEYREDGYSKRLVTFNVYDNFRMSNGIIVSKLTDDYYLLRLVTTNANKIIQFKCDEFEGLLDCMDHVFTLLNFIYN